VNKTAAPAFCNITTRGYGSRLKAGTTVSGCAATLAYFLIRISNSQFRLDTVIASVVKQSMAQHEESKRGLLRYARNDV
jgi:hypothetical protein